MGGPWTAMEPGRWVHLFGTSAVLCAIIVATVVGNVFVVAAIVLERNLQNVANYLVASLAVADLLVAALVMPIAAVNEVRGQGRSQEFLTGGGQNHPKNSRPFFFFASSVAPGHIALPRSTQLQYSSIAPLRLPWMHVYFFKILTLNF